MLLACFLQKKKMAVGDFCFRERAHPVRRLGARGAARAADGGAAGRRRDAGVPRARKHLLRQRSVLSGLVSVNNPLCNTSKL